MTLPLIGGGDGGKSPVQVLTDVANVNLLEYFLTTSLKHNYLDEVLQFLTFCN